MTPSKTPEYVKIASQLESILSADQCYQLSNFFSLEDGDRNNENWFRETISGWALTKAQIPYILLAYLIENGTFQKRADRQF